MRHRVAGGRGIAALCLFVGCSNEPRESTSVAQAKLEVPGLVAAYSFDEGTGSVLHDLTSNGNDGALSGQTWIVGKYGTGLSFNGNFITVPDAPSLDLTTTVTLSAWVRPLQAQGWYPTIALKETAGGLSYALYAGDVGPEPGFCLGSSGESDQCVFAGSVQEDSWTHLAGTFDGSVYHFYVDGDLAGSLVEDMPAGVSAEPLRIGGNTVWDEFFRGVIDELRVYSRALSPAEIQADLETPLNEMPDTAPPVANISLPAENASVSGLVDIFADTSTDLSVASVKFFVDGTLQSEDDWPPFRATWDATPVSLGAHAISIEARDTAGNISTDDVSVTVEAPPATLVAAYSFDEGTGSVLHDVSGYGNDGELSGQTWVAGKYGSALSFDGTFVTVPDSASLDLTNRMTITAWVRPLATHDVWPTIVLKERPSGLSYSLYSQWLDTQPTMCVGVLNSPEDCAYGGGTPLDIWTHLTGTFDGDVQRVYVNGELAGTFARDIAAPASDEPLRIGGNSIWPTELFTGLIDNVRIYSRALTPSEILTDMATPVAPSDCAGATIDDGNPCTNDACDTGSGVTHTPVGAGTSCSDGDACNGAEACNAAGTCVAGTAPSVDDGNPCTTDGCDAATGVSHTPVAQGTSCTDENACNGSETCDAMGACVPGTPVSCVALDQCHDVGTCSPATGACTNPPKANGSTCADGNSCTQTDTCQAGSCVGSNAVTCTASDACHDAGTCNPVDGICSKPVKQDGTTCPDDDICNGAETCQAGACTSGTPLTVDDGNPCTADACSAAGGVTHTALANGIVCASGDACSSASTCSAGTCVPGMPANVDDGNPCTADSCTPGTGPVHAPLANGTTCGDGDLCNGEETCQLGTCSSGASVNVDDGNPCTVDSCSPLSGVVSHDPGNNGTSCSDGNICNGSETCLVGTCVPGTPQSEDDGNPCTEDSCDPTQGAVHSPSVAGSSCSDANACNGAESCDGAGTCLPGVPVDTHSDNDCEVGNCNPVTGVVTFIPANPGTLCTIDACSSGACDTSGVCTPSGASTADDGDQATIDTCDQMAGIKHRRAPDLDQTIAPTVSSAGSWLISGPDPIQVGVAAGTIEPRRAAIVRGFVETTEGVPVGNGVVVVEKHPEYGSTVTQANGEFDMLVNGGAPLTFTVQATGYLMAQRSITVAWNSYANVDKMLLTRHDPIVTPVDLEDSDEMQVARSSIVAGDDGARQGTLLFPSGVIALMHHANGTVEELPAMNVRITEFTSKLNNPAAMPAQLPAQSAYTYAFEINADEAVEAGAPEITFSEPLVYYVENFLEFPTGTAVPLGSLNRATGQWKADESGVIVKVIDTAGGVAALDIDGDGLVDGPAQVAARGITSQELARIASLYAIGQSLWRVRITHFTEPYDCNWNAWPPDDAEEPSDPEPKPDDPDDPDDDDDNECKDDGGSVVGCQTQTLHEDVPIAGTSFSLHYSSARSSGRTDGVAATIRVVGSSVPPSTKRVDLQITIAGQTIVQSFAPVPNTSTRFVWNGRDVWGRRLAGSQQARVMISNVYDAKYVETPTFGASAPVEVVTTDRSRGEFKFNASSDFALRGTVDPLPLGFGGWTLSAHHVYQPGSSIITRGDGSVTGLAQPLSAPSFAGTGSGGPLIPAGVVARTMVIDQLGSLIHGTANQVFRVQSSGRTLLAGAASGGVQSEEVPATSLDLFSPNVALATDGTLVLTDLRQHKVFRIGVDGIAHRLAGRGAPTSTAFAGDGGPAVDAQLFRPATPVVAPDGNVYFIDEGNCRVRAVATDGTIRTVLGTGCLSSPTPAQQLVTEGPATLTYFLPTALTIDPEGTLYVAHFRTIAGTGSPSVTEVFSIRTDGRLRLELGCKATPCSAQDGVDALSFQHTNTIVRALATDWSGNVYFTNGNCAIRQFSPKGVVTTVAGGSTCSGEAGLIANGAPATSFAPWLNGVAYGAGGLFGAQESLINPSSNGAVLFRISSQMPALGGANLVVANASGRELDVFDPLTGRHQQKLDAYTGAQILGFNYTGSLVSSIVDRDGRQTNIERGAGGVASAIVSPDNQRTTLHVDTNGYLSSIIDPAGGTVLLEHTPSGLLTRFTNQRGFASMMAYDAQGRLQSDSDPAGGSIGLSRVETGFGLQRVSTVTKTSALGRVTTYETRAEGTNGLVITTMPDGTSASTTLTSAGTRIVTSPDGTVRTTTRSTDRLYGLIAGPLSETTRVPSGLTNVVTKTRAYTTGPTSFVRTDTETRNGRIWRAVFNRGAGTETLTSPVGRTVTHTLDALGRLVSTRTGALDPINAIFGSNGQLSGMMHGSRLHSYSYFAPGDEAAGYLAAVTDPTNVVTSFSRDAVGRVVTETRSSSTTGFTWDFAGNLTSVTPPGRPAHGMTYTPVNLLASYDPPSASLPASSTSYTFDADRFQRTETRADAAQIARTPDSAGRLDTVAIPGGLIEYDYYPPGLPTGSGKTSDILGPYGTDLHFTYDGMLTKSITWSGDVAGSVAWNYDTDFNKILETVSGAMGTAQAAFGYDNDQLLTCASPTTCNPPGSDALRLIRSPQHGLITSITLGGTSETWTYNTSGELARQTATFAPSTPLVDITYDAPGFERDKLGRIVRKTEVIGGVTKVFGYTYDNLRRLTDVTVNGVIEEHFEYDANGNRTLGVNATAATSYTGTYDDQDRLLSYGPWTFTYTANGELETKTNTSTGDAWLFQYDVLGNQMTVGLPNGDLVEYLVDGMGRRVGKKKNGVLLKQWVYRDALKPVAEFDGAGALVAKFVYGSKSNVPDYVRRGTTMYRVVSDHLGSPRYVVNVANSAEVPFTASYSSFGVVAGTGLDWMPFGFAGGMYDPDDQIIRFGKRDLDPATGRWKTKEPLRFSAGDNFYLYAGGDPVNFVDTSGTVAVADDVIIAGGAVILFGGVALYAVLSGNHDALDRLVHAVEHALPDSVCPIRGEGKELDRIAKDLGIDRDQLRKAIEKIKHAGGLRGSDNVDVLPDGTVVDRASGDPIGNVYDEQGD